MEELFIAHFVSSRKQRKTNAILLNLRQTQTESLRDFLKRFNKESREISNLDTSVALAAFRHNVRNRLLRISLAKNPPETYAELLRRCEKYINVEEGLGGEDQRGQGEKRRLEPEKGARKAQKTDPGQRQPVPRLPKFEKYTPLTISLSAILNEVKSEGVLPIPPKLKTPAHKKNKAKWCQYHRDHGHTTEECRTLKDDIEALIRRGHLKKFVQKPKQATGEQPRDQTQEERPEASTTEPVIHVISGGPIGGPSKSSQKAYVREVTTVQGPLPKKNPGQIITFSDEDYDGVHHPHCDPLVVSLSMANHRVKRILVDNGSSVDVLFLEAFDKLKLGREKLKPVGYTLHGFAGSPIKVEGVITLPITIGTSPRNKTIPIDFMVVNINSAYNAILGRSGLTALEAIPSAIHMKMKFPTPAGVGEVVGDQESSRSCYTTSLQKAVLPFESLDPRDLSVETGPVNEIKEIPFCEQEPFKTFKISKNLKGGPRRQIVGCL